MHTGLFLRIQNSRSINAGQLIICKPTGFFMKIIFQFAFLLKELIYLQAGKSYTTSSC